MTVLRYYSILSEFVVVLPFHPSIDSAAAQDEIQSGMLCDDYDLFDGPKSFQIQGPFVTLLQFILPSTTLKHKARSLKRGRSREIPSDKGPEILDYFFISGKGGQNPLKTLSQDGDGNEK